MAWDDGEVNFDWDEFRSIVKILNQTQKNETFKKTLESKASEKAKRLIRMLLNEYEDLRKYGEWQKYNDAHNALENYIAELEEGF